MIKISVTGVKELDAVFKGLPKLVSHKMLSDVHATAAKTLVDRAKLLAPLGETMNLTKSIGVERESLKTSTTSLGQVQAGPRRGRFKGQVGHLVEYGTKPRKLKSNGAYRGVMKIKKFMEPAFMQTKEVVERIISYQLSRHIVNYIKANVK